MFGTNENLQRLVKSKYWVMDGTFSSVLNLFRQLFTIHGSSPPSHQHTFPLVYVLMTSKSEELYRKVFQTLNDIGDDLEIQFKPDVILSDFEKAIVNASKTEFKDSKHNACFFYLSQNMWKHVQHLGLTKDMNNDVKSFDFFKQTQALAFLPPSKIPEAFDMLKASALYRLTEFFSYFEENYVHGRVRRTTKQGRVTRNDPLYPPSLWSVYDNIKKAIPRTTNQIESWHSQWNSIVGHHAGVLKMIEKFRLEEKYVSGQILGYLSANSSKRRKTDSELNDGKISKIVNNLTSMTNEDYLKAIAANLGSKSK
ncbi:uncharacterized protein LOC110678299 [Aedes aegypti]|uniref:MULE transposase domain-containing protein n=1 Tax=Aedes aegypti TaxID=7159 RepID=A0A6I8TNE9_AEDAE|nr:uncharacterized protein LOC110678299 [Aedes aegypti]